METLSYQAAMVFGVLFMGVGSLGWAQERYPTEPNWEAVCAKAKAAPFTVPKVIAPAGCDSESLYYGFKAAPDYKAALACAYEERKRSAAYVPGSVSGEEILMMLYANGLAVQRNYDLAIRFSCENSWGAAAEMEYRIGHLEYLRDHAAAKAKRFDLCNDVTSGLMEGTCAYIDEQPRVTQRERKIKALSAKWPAEAQAPFQELLKVERAFADARSGNEIDLTGTGRAAFSIVEASKVQDQFVTNLKTMVHGEVPKATAADYRAADAKLNTEFRTVIAQHEKEEDIRGGMVKPQGIRETERVWIKLRDDWAAFGVAAFPGVSAEQVKTWITQQRIKQLKDVE